MQHEYKEQMRSNLSFKFIITNIRSVYDLFCELKQVTN